MDRPTVTSRRVRELVNKPVKLFLQNGIALDGVLLDYTWDPTEKEGVLTITSTKGDPTLVFKRFVTTIQPQPPKKK